MAKVNKNKLPEVHIDIGSHNYGKNPDDKRFSLSKEYVGHPSGKPVYVLRFVSHYIASTPLKKDADAMKKAVMAAHENYPLTVKQMQNVAAPYSDLYHANPAHRIGTAKPRRRSQITGKAPSKRLVTRRKANTRKGYFPNPINEPAKGALELAIVAAIKSAKTPSKLAGKVDNMLVAQARLSFAQGLIQAAEIMGVFTRAEVKLFMTQLKPDGVIGK